jgi:hypothetical protein
MSLDKVPGEPVQSSALPCRSKSPRFRRAKTYESSKERVNVSVQRKLSRLRAGKTRLLAARWLQEEMN